MAEKELQQLQKLHSELASVKKLMGTLQQRINQIEEVIYFKCDHYWILDRANVGERTEYVCTRCNLSKNDNLKPKLYWVPTKMKEYNCEKCGKIFMHKHNYLHHTQRKKPCNPFFTDACVQPPKIDTPEAPTYKIYNKNLVLPNCVYCNEVFSSNSARNRHMEQTCKLRARYKELIAMYDQELENLEAENLFLKTTYANLFGEKYLFPFGLEKFRHINHKHIENIIKEPISGMLEFINDYHFNPKRIQFQNIRPTKFNRIEVYNGKRWEIEDIDIIIEKLLTIYRDTIEFTVEKINLPGEQYVTFSNHLESLFANPNEESSKYRRIVQELRFILETKIK